MLHAKIQFRLRTFKVNNFYVDESFRIFIYMLHNIVRKNPIEHRPIAKLAQLFHFACIFSILILRAEDKELIALRQSGRLCFCVFQLFEDSFGFFLFYSIKYKLN